MLNLDNLLIGWFFNKKSSSTFKFRKLWGKLDETLEGGQYKFYLFNSFLIRKRFFRYWSTEKCCFCKFLLFYSKELLFMLFPFIKWSFFSDYLYCS